MYEKWLDILKMCTLFDGMDSKQLDIMLQCLRPKVSNYKKGENVTLEGREYEGIGVILKGSAAVTKENAAGSRTIMAKLGPSDMFGEIAAFSKKRVWPATVVALDGLSIMLMPPDKIIGTCHNLCFSHTSLINNMLRIISDKALMLNKKVDYLTMGSIRTKLCSFFLEQQKKAGSSTFMMPMNRNELADFLSVSRPSLSREMCKMRDEGVIEFHRSSIRIRDLESLKEMIL